MEQKEALRLALVQRTKEARQNAYTPYSGFAVGAALLCADGTVYAGCNIENAGFTATCCAERTAFFRAVNDAELYGNIAELRQLYNTYLKPIAATAIGEKTWSSPEEAGDLLMLAEDIAWAVDGISFRDRTRKGRKSHQRIHSPNKSIRICH